MTIEELKDLIDSTINENGSKAITGQALNLALNEIVNAVAEAATTGGSAAKTLYVGSDSSPLTQEQIASNIALYNEISTALSNKEIPPQVSGVAYLDQIGGNVGFLANVIFVQESVVGLYSFPVTAMLTSDGSVTVQFAA